MPRHDGLHVDGVGGPDGHRLGLLRLPGVHAGPQNIKKDAKRPKKDNFSQNSQSKKPD